MLVLVFAHVALAQQLARIMDDCVTYVLPPEPKRPPSEWPADALRAWPPYSRAPAPGQLVYCRGSRDSNPLARVLAVPP